MVVISRSIVDYGYVFFVVLVSQTSNYKKISSRMVYYINSLCCFCTKHLIVISLTLKSFNFWVFAKFQLLKPET